MVVPLFGELLKSLTSLANIYSSSVIPAADPCLFINCYTCSVSSKNKHSSRKNFLCHSVRLWVCESMSPESAVRRIHKASTQRTAAAECWLLTKVNHLWRHWVVVELCAVVSISFVLKSQWALEPHSHYLCYCWLAKWLKQRKCRKNNTFLLHTSYIAVFRKDFIQPYESWLIIKALKEDGWMLT